MTRMKRLWKGALTLRRTKRTPFPSPPARASVIRLSASGRARRRADNHLARRVDVGDIQREISQYLQKGLDRQVLGNDRRHSSHPHGCRVLHQSASFMNDSNGHAQGQGSRGNQGRKLTQPVTGKNGRLQAEQGV
jgi:hypothetical protein